MLNDSVWIRSNKNVEGGCLEFYTTAAIEKKVSCALLTVTAVGMYEVSVNGNRVGNALYTPGWTQYEKRIQYQQYDITQLLHQKDQKLYLSFLCSEGWAVGTIGYDNLRNSFSDHIAIRFSLDISYEDGSQNLIVSNDKIKVRTSYIRKSGIYDGEIFDYTYQTKELGFAVLDHIDTELVKQQGPNVTEQERICAVSFITNQQGEKIIDFGQNLSGYVEIRLHGTKGDKIVISHAEVLDKKGNFYTENLRYAKQKMMYILDKDSDYILKPKFTWQGFRYIRIDEFPQHSDIKLEDFTAIVVHSDIKRTGEFECGNEQINQLYHNIIWGQKGNYIDIPTDCPQRDERLGWTGDAQVFIRTAAINYDVEQFFQKWLYDLKLSQGIHGEVYGIVPLVKLNYPTNVSAAWGDAAVICPWEIYKAYGNKEILETQFDSMKKWIDYMHNAGSEEYLWLGGNHYGDWLAMDNPKDGYMGSTSTDYIASAFFAYSTSILIKVGKILGIEINSYEELYQNIVKAFRNKYMDKGIPVENTQTAYTLALYFHLCTDEKATACKLNDMIKENGTRLTTGFVGTPYLLHALSEQGFVDTAYDLLFQEKAPSWLFSVNHGATTMWEHWDGIKEDESFWSSHMNSFNHYAYGAVYDWIFSVAAGIKVCDEGAGYKKIFIEPHTDIRMRYLKASINTRLGMLESAWYIEEDKVKYYFKIPNGCTAEILLPDGKKQNVAGPCEFTYSIGI